MIIHGRIENGVVRLLDGPALAEGTEVVVLVGRAMVQLANPATDRWDIPVVCGGKPGTVNLTNERIAEIFEEEDLAYMARCLGTADPPTADAEK
jgi:hypothetical protein